MNGLTGWTDTPNGKKTVVLGITGCIAAYRAADIASTLVKAGLDVHVVMTPNAQRFITSCTMETLTQNPVTTDLFDRDRPWEVGHVALAQKADAVLIAPCTANMLGKLAGGIADDMLSTTVMATKAPVIIAPAMNTGMYENPLVQQNIARLKALGYRFIGPISGRLACGDTGMGHIAPTEEIAAAVFDALKSQPDLAGLRILVTAGPTQEPIDPVRFIGNRSSGKMGYAIAQACIERGAEVTLVSGPVSLNPPKGAALIITQTAQQMHDAVMTASHGTDMVIMAAAVADFTPDKPSPNKLKKADAEMKVTLMRTPDILAELGKNKKPGQILVGFAAETENLLEHAAKKLAEKNLDMIAANDVTKPGAGFGCDTNIITLIMKDGRKTELGPAPKARLAHAILDEAVRLCNARRG